MLGSEWIAGTAGKIRNMTFTKVAFIKTLSLKIPVTDNDLFVWTSVSFHSAEMSAHVWLIGM